MTLQEIQYKAQAIMQKWRDDDSAPYVEFVEELASMDVPELPEGLEKAAEEYAGVDYDRETETDAFYHHIETTAFRVGAEWQMEQMMKKAFRCEIIKSRTHMPHLKPYFFSSDYGKIGDKVKVIVIPEEK